MANDNGTGEKTEQATPKKRQDAKERGQVLKSNELVMAGTLLIMFGALRALYPMILENLGEFATSYLTGQHMTMVQLNEGNFLPVWQNMVVGFLTIMLPLLAIALLAGVIMNVIQVGFNFSTKALEPKMSRLNPLEGIKRMFSVRSLFELAKSIAKVVAIGLVVYTAIQDNIGMFPTLMNTNLHGSLLRLSEVIFDAAFKILIVLAAIAVLDYVFQRFMFEKDLRMSKYEVKMEMKQQEGDPQIKGRIRQKQRQMAMMRMMADVPDADVVITNPTQYAVALKYDEEVGDAPKVLAIGKDHLAARIKEIAGKHNIDIVENKPLARSLYAYCQVGDFIPVDLYQAVAEILAQIYKNKPNM